MPAVSVIIPIYGVEEFISHCATTLMLQTLEDVEFIFVDDASPDGSVETLQSVLKRFPQRRTKLLRHDVNRGLPAARNTGLKVATGDYVFHCDGDDFVEPDMLEVLYDVASAREADIVWCDWFLNYGQRQRYMSQPQYDSAFKALKSMLSGGMKYNVWNKLVKRRLYVDGNVCFPSGWGMGEDLTMIKLFAYANNVAYVPKAFYHYNKMNLSAFSQTYSEQHLRELRHNIDTLIEFVQNRYGDALEEETAFLKLEAKYPFIISDGRHGRYRLWNQWYPEANRYILRNKYVSWRSRAVQWFAWKKIYPLVWLYYVLVINLMPKLLKKKK